MESIYQYTIILLLLELVEAYLQRAQTLFGVIERLYGYYKQSIFLFFLVQPGFYFTLFVALETGVLNAAMIFLLALKIFDIFYKIELVRKVWLERKVPKELAAMLTWEMPSWFFFIGAVLYPSLLFFSLS